MTREAVRLEKGRNVNPSLTTIDALARALRLGKAEHNHLRALARHGDHRVFAKEAVPDAIRHLVESMPHPAYITGRRWDVLAWNKAAEEVFVFDRMAEEDRNTLISMLTKPASRRLFGTSWADEARRMVAMFRTTHDLWADDPPSSTCSTGCGATVRNSPAVGKPTTSATSLPARSGWSIRRRVCSASSTRRSSATTSRGSSW